jgi:hypothetical protein
MSEFLTSAAKSDIRVVVKNIVTNMQKIKMLREDITEASKGVAEKYEGEITAQDIKTMARLEYDKENVVEKEEKAQKPFDLYKLIMEDDQEE